MAKVRPLLAALFLLAAAPAQAARLTVKLGETWLFTVKNGEPAQARKVPASAKIPKGEIKVSARSLLGTAMTITNNSPVAYSFKAELLAGGRATVAPRLHFAGQCPPGVRAMGAKGGRRANRQIRHRRRERALLMAKLYFYYAAMNAGKSTTLLQADYNYRERGMETMLWTAALDDRPGVGAIGSRIALSAAAHTFDESIDLFEAISDELGSGRWTASSSTRRNSCRSRMCCSSARSPTS